MSKELQELEMNRSVDRKVGNTKPGTVAYSSTPYAETLNEVIDAMMHRGENYRKKITGK